MSFDLYDNPLVTRYASPWMSELWSPQRRIATWRRLWVALAEAQRELGLDISAQQIEALRRNVDTIDFDRAAEYERRFRHDVMAHVHAFADQAPEARGIIHLGATSAFVTDNTDLILIREGLRYVAGQLAGCIDAMAHFAQRYRDLPCLAFTHLQPAQPTTLGKRAALWCYDLVLDLTEVEHRLAQLRFRGVKGTTGTQASFLQLLGGDHAKVEDLDRFVAGKMDFEATYPVTGQTYSRKVDAQVVAALSGIAQSAHKFGTDLRLLQSRDELLEPFEEEQIGSSAMPYKRNPMRAERMCSLSRFLMSLVTSADQTAAVQWLERTLDDSAGRRLVIPQAFLAADAVLRLYRNIADGMVVNSAVIRRHLEEQLPFLATEKILMAAAAAGGDRQDLHERLRQHSQAAADHMRQAPSPQRKQGLSRGSASKGSTGEPQPTAGDLLDRLRADPAFGKVDFNEVLDPAHFTGRAPQQVDAFLSDLIAPIHQRYAGQLTRTSETDVRV